MDEPARLLEKLQRLHALEVGATSKAERQAASRARVKVVARLRELGITELPKNPPPSRPVPIAPAPARPKRFKLPVEVVIVIAAFGLLGIASLFRLPTKPKKDPWVLEYEAKMRGQYQQRNQRRNDIIKAFTDEDEEETKDPALKGFGAKAQKDAGVGQAWDNRFYKPEEFKPELDVSGESETTAYGEDPLNKPQGLDKDALYNPFEVKPKTKPTTIYDDD